MHLRNIAHKLGALIQKHGSINGAAVNEFCQANNLQKLGYGCFGAAFATKCGKVLKISFSLQDGTMGYIAEACRHFIKNAKPAMYVPIVYAFERCKKFWWAVMEQCKVGYGDMDDYHCVKQALHRFLKGRSMGRDAYLGGGNYSYKLNAGAGDTCWDLHSGNYGKTPDGRTIVFDPFGSATRVKTDLPKQAIKVRNVYGPAHMQPRF